MVESNEKSQKIKRLEDKHREVELKHQNILAEIKAERERHLKWEHSHGEVKAFGVVRTSPKIPVWLVATIIVGLLASIIYIANNPAQ
jgi:hypothetical protein